MVSIKIGCSILYSLSNISLYSHTHQYTNTTAHVFCIPFLVYLYAIDVFIHFELFPNIGFDSQQQQQQQTEQNHLTSNTPLFRFYIRMFCKSNRYQLTFPRTLFCVRPLTFFFGLIFFMFEVC